MTIAARIMMELEVGPATVRELIFELDLPSRALNAHMNSLYRQGRVDRTEFHDPSNPFGRKSVYLYWLPEQRRMAA